MREWLKITETVTFYSNPGRIFCRFVRKHLFMGRNRRYKEPSRRVNQFTEPAQ
jgi:hypothetical protein